MEIKELKIKSDAELAKLVLEWQDKLRDWRFRVGAEQIKNVREIREAKKTVARIKTLLKQRSTK
ncbi:MAG: 50S ribosomal protein L29 [bacterium]